MTTTLHPLQLRTCVVPSSSSSSHLNLPPINTPVLLPPPSIAPTHLATFPSRRCNCICKRRFCAWNSRKPREVCTSASDQSQRENLQSDGFIRKKLAVFVSGGGSNFRILHKSTLDNVIYGDIAVVVSDKPDCKACDYARSNNIPVVFSPKGKYATDGLSPVELVATLRQFEIDIVLLAGYLRLLPEELVQAFPRAILNIHPALLPAFGGKGYYGMKVHEAVIKSGARYSGASIHFVDEKYDHGVILAQRVVSVLPYDTPDDLAARVLKEEHTLYTEVVAALCEDRIFWREDGVPLIRKSWSVAEYH